MQQSCSDVAVVGGGIAGLSAAVAASGRERVTVLEGKPRLGGRALTLRRGGFCFNLGPHALYQHGAAARVMQAWGLTLRGGRPPNAGVVLRDSETTPLPAGIWSLLRCAALPLRAKLEVAHLLMRLPRLECEPDASLAEWLESTTRSVPARQLMEMLARLTTYIHAPRRLSARVGLSQIQLSLSGGVRYLDGGWASWVEGLSCLARRRGVKIHASSKVTSIAPEASGWILRGPRLQHACRRVIIAAPPSTACQLLGGIAPAGWLATLDALTPVRASCLTLGLRRLPNPRRRLALGFSEPTYFSAHTPYADLAAGGEVVHLVRYLSPDDEGAPVEALEAIMDRAQPGWRHDEVARHFAPRLLVTLALPAPGADLGRPCVDVPRVRGIRIAGDWVGPEGHLVDAAVASGVAAGAPTNVSNLAAGYG